MRIGVASGLGGRFIAARSADDLHCSLRSAAAPCTLSPSSRAFWSPVSFGGTRSGGEGRCSGSLGSRFRAARPKRASPSARFPGRAWRGRAVRRRRPGPVSEGTWFRLPENSSGQIGEAACPLCVCTGFCPRPCGWPHFSLGWVEEGGIGVTSPFPHRLVPVLALVSDMA